MEEKELCHRYRVFMRFHSKEEHDELLRSVVEEQRILKRIEDLQVCYAVTNANCKATLIVHYARVESRMETYQTL